MPDRPMLGLALRNIRELRGMTQEELAEKSGIGRGKIVEYEKGENLGYKYPELLKALDVHEGVVEQLTEVLEALQEGLEQGGNVLPFRRPPEPDGGETPYPQHSEQPPTPSALAETAEPGGENAGDLERVVLDGARFLRSFLRWFASRLPRPPA